MIEWSVQGYEKIAEAIFLKKTWTNGILAKVRVQNKWVGLLYKNVFWIMTMDIL